jgi:hypothetical protein
MFYASLRYVPFTQGIKGRVVTRSLAADGQIRWSDEFRLTRLLEHTLEVIRKPKPAKVYVLAWILVLALALWSAWVRVLAWVLELA